MKPASQAKPCSTRPKTYNHHPKRLRASSSRGRSPSLIKAVLNQQHFILVPYLLSRKEYRMFDTEIAATRFGTGLSSHHGGPSSLSEMGNLLAKPDRISKKYPVPTFASYRSEISELTLTLRDLQKERKKNPSSTDYRDYIRSYRAKSVSWRVAHMRRYIENNDQFRERLVLFWEDHFTTVGKAPITRIMTPAYSEEAIRPHVAGRFSEMLKAAETHPMMVLYLDQNSSYGPRSRAGKRQKAGLNENLAREILELHTMGVDGAYTQNDVRHLAYLLTGITYRHDRGTWFNRNAHEPGPQDILGKTYGLSEDGIAEIASFLEDISIHPDTANHLCRKLAYHFIGPDASPDMISSMVEAYRSTDGHLMHVYAAMLDHPGAWVPEFTKARLPYEFICSALKALPVGADAWQAIETRQFRRRIQNPLSQMGQPISGPSGPDGWSEEFGDWINPQNLAARIQWSMQMPAFASSFEVDPVQFAKDTLGSRADKRILFAARGAETKWAGVGLVLSSPAFNRR